MSQERVQELFNYLLVGVGTTGTATVEFWSTIDLGLSIFLKFVSLATFICFLLINQDDISKGYKKRKDRIKQWFVRYFKLKIRNDGAKS